MDIRLNTLILVGLGLTGCSFLDDPPPYRVLNPTLDSGSPEDAAPRIDFAQRTDDAFVPTQPTNFRRDMEVMPETDQGLSRPQDLGTLADAGTSIEGTPTCLKACDSPDECTGDDICDEGLCRRPDMPDVCGVPDGCLASLSDWSRACTQFSDCPQGQGCIRVDTLGRCAPFAVDMECEDPSFDVIVRRDFADGGQLDVCGQARAICADDVCILGCLADEDCQSDPQHPTCDTDSKRCVCRPNTCEVNASSCNEQGRCVCTADADCTAFGLDTCVDGQCVCSSDQGCTDGADVSGQYQCVVVSGEM